MFNLDLFGILGHYCADPAINPWCVGLPISILAGLLVLLIVWLGAKIINWLFAAKRVFLSMPMASIETREEYDELQKFARDLAEKLERVPRVKLYCAIRDISYEDWSRNHSTPIEVLRSIRKCKYFVSVLPDRIYTSSLIELGYGLARGKTVIAWYREWEKEGRPQSTLPYLLQRLHGNRSLGIRITKHKYRDLNDILDVARQDPKGFLGPDELDND